MLHRYAIAVSLLIAFVGGGAGYRVAGSLHGELRDISGQLSALRQTVSGNSHSPGQAREYGVLNAAARMNEIAPIVSAAVRDTLQLHFSTDSTPCFYQSQPDSRAMPVHKEPGQDPEIIRAGAEQADAILAAAIDMGIWDRDSAQAFAIALHALPDTELADAYRKLSQAVNSGNLQLPEEIDPTLLLTGSSFNSR